LAIVGESGSGKSVTALSIMRLIPAPGRIESGDIIVNGGSVLARNDFELRQMRGFEVAMVFQDPLTALNPVHTVGAQLTEAIRLHQRVSMAVARRMAADLLGSVQVPPSRLDDYPHNFSGGMRQRVMIAMAIANDPAVLIADEPTTALDVTTQAQILELLDQLCAAHQAAVLLITHDLGVVAGFCDRTIVMYGGRVMESAATATLLQSPAHPYSLGLLESHPRSEGDVEALVPIPGQPTDPLALPSGCVFHERCRFRRERCVRERPMLRAIGPHQEVACHFAEEIRAGTKARIPEGTVVGPVPEAWSPDGLLEVRNLVKHYPLRHRRGVVSAVENVSFTLRQGETLGVVGESGSGKTTTAMMTLGLVQPTAGSVRFRGQDVSGLSGKELRKFRREAQPVFQDPYSALDPRMRVRQLITEPMAVHAEGDGAARAARADELLETVGLLPSHADLYPYQFSGGQRQRIGIARALALRPTLLVCDEPVSSLDVSVRAQVLNLLRTLQRQLGLTYFFVAHDISVIRYISDRTAVMYLGKIVEIGTKAQVFANPRHPYTQTLLSAAPVLTPGRQPRRIILRGEIPSATNAPAACRFHTRCPIAQAICRSEEPPLRVVPSGQAVACHFAEDSSERMRSARLV
jgi:oligopeptide/dipeptide ABC transporter ATP-binding protein